MYFIFEKVFSGLRKELKRIKDVKRAKMGQQRLEVLALLAIESDLLNKIDLKKMIDEFAVTKARKVSL